VENARDERTIGWLECILYFRVTRQARCTISRTVIQIRKTTISRIKVFATFVVAYSMVGFVWERLDVGESTVAGVFIGFLVGITLFFAEELNVAAKTKTMSFSATVLVKSLIYLAIISVPWILAGLFGGLAKGFGMAEFFDWILSMEFLGQIGKVYLIHLTFVSIRDLNSLLGPGKLLRYMTGKYHRPKVEDRIFMFLDLKSSTSLAEQMSETDYFSFLNSFFRDMTDPIVERGAEIYQYIGDEVVLTWPTHIGLHDANCIRIFVEILAEIHHKEKLYLEKYGFSPEFKAGVHLGKVVTAEIGDLKKEIVYSGDVLNTTARIQSMCNEFGSNLLVSEALVSAIKMPEFVSVKSLGGIELKGKAQPTSIAALSFDSVDS